MGTTPDMQRNCPKRSGLNCGQPPNPRVNTPEAKRLAEQAILAGALELTKETTVLQYTSLLAGRRARQRLRDTQN